MPYARATQMAAAVGQGIAFIFGFVGLCSSTRCWSSSPCSCTASQEAALPVVSRDGRLLGLITPETVGEMMMLHASLPRGSLLAWRG